MKRPHRPLVADLLQWALLALLAAAAVGSLVRVIGRIPPAVDTMPESDDLSPPNNGERP